MKLKKRQKVSSSITVILLVFISLVYIPVQRNLNQYRITKKSIEEELTKIPALKWSSVDGSKVREDINDARRLGLTDTEIWVKFKANHPIYPKLKEMGAIDKEIIEHLELKVSPQPQFQEDISKVEKSLKNYLQVRLSVTFILLAIFIIGGGITLILGLDKSTGFESNIERGFFRLVLVLSILVFIFGITFLSMKGDLLEGLRIGSICAAGIWIMYFFVKFIIAGFKRGK